MTFYIRMAAPHEIDGLLDFISRIFPDSDIAVGEEDRLLVAEENGRIRGFAHVIELQDKVILQGLGVEESHRGVGIGSSLVGRICDIYRGGSRPIFLKTKIDNPAIDMYSKHGFFIRRFGTVPVLVKRQNC